MAYLVPGAPGSGFVSQYMGGELPGAGARYALVPRGTPDIDPVRAAALSAAYANPANWTHTGGDAGLIGAGPGGGGFQPNLNAINRAGALAVAAPPPNRYAGLAIGDTPGGAQNAVLNTRQVRLQGITADRNYGLALQQQQQQQAQREIENQFRNLTRTDALGERAEDRAFREKGFGLNERQQALSELVAMEKLGGTKGYQAALADLAKQDAAVRREYTTATSQLFDVATEEAGKAPGTKVVIGADGIPQLVFDPILSGRDAKTFDPDAATKKYNAAVAAFQKSPAMVKFAESEARLADIQIKAEQLNQNLRYQVPMGTQVPQQIVFDQKAGKFVNVAPGGNVKRGMATPLASQRILLPQGTTPNPRYPQPPLGIPYGSRIDAIPPGLPFFEMPRTAAPALPPAMAPLTGWNPSGLSFGPGGQLLPAPVAPRPTTLPVTEEELTEFLRQRM